MTPRTETEVTTHELKVWPEFFQGLTSGDKPFELRFNDRDFRVGDTLRLLEFLPIDDVFTGREVTRVVTCIVRGKPWLEDGYVCLGLASPSPSGAPETKVIDPRPFGDDVDERDMNQLRVQASDHHCTGWTCPMCGRGVNYKPDRECDECGWEIPADIVFAGAPETASPDIAKFLIVVERYLGDQCDWGVLNKDPAYPLWLEAERLKAPPAPPAPEPVTPALHPEFERGYLKGAEDCKGSTAIMDDLSSKLAKAQARIAQLMADLAKKDRYIELVTQELHRYTPCADHRDKTGHECPACYGERTARARLTAAEAKENRHDG